MTYNFCYGPNCTKKLKANSNHPDFCSRDCQMEWARQELFVEPPPEDNGMGRVYGVSWSPSICERNNGTHIKSYAFSWLDSRVKDNEDA